MALVPSCSSSGRRVSSCHRVSKFATSTLAHMLQAFASLHVLAIVGVTAESLTTDTNSGESGCCHNFQDAFKGGCVLVTDSDRRGR